VPFDNVGRRTDHRTQVFLEKIWRFGDDFLVANPNSSRNLAPPVVNDPLAPPHATTDIPVLVPRVFRASILGAKRHSESAASLGDGMTCGQTRHATSDNQFETEGDLHHLGATQGRDYSFRRPSKDDHFRFGGGIIQPTLRGASCCLL
jgi:hypothetical protein